MATAPQTRLATRPGVKIEYLARGEGPPVVLIPSWGRDGEDYHPLAAALAEAGYRAIQPRPRGSFGSRASMEGVTLVDLAADVGSVIEAEGRGPAVVVGHALGNRVGRMLTAQRPDLVRAVVLVAAGGKVPPLPEHRQAWTEATRQIEGGTPTADVIGRAYFAPGNDATPWVTGWNPAVRIMQNHAVTTAKLDEWWTAGRTAPILVVQALQDTVAVPENGRSLKAELGERVQLVEIDHAGHALLIEQPAAVTAAILQFLGRVAPLPR